VKTGSAAAVSAAVGTACRLDAVEGVAGVTNDNGIILNSLLPQATFDLMFFGTFGVGWIISWFYQREFLWNNNIARVYFQYNICVGVDSFPARPFAGVMYVLAMLVLGNAVSIMSMNLRYEDAGGVWLRGLRYFCIYGGTLGCACFTLSLAVPPDDAFMSFIHVLGFILSLFGYALIKLAGALQFQSRYADPAAQWPELEKQRWPVTLMPRKARIMLRCKSIATACCNGSAAEYYYWSRLFAAAFLTVAGLVLSSAVLGYLRTDLFAANPANIVSSAIPAIVEGGYPLTIDEVKPGWSGWFLVLFALVDPFIAIFFMNKTVALATEQGVGGYVLVMRAELVTATPSV